MKRGIVVLLLALVALLCCPDFSRAAASEACPLSVEPILPEENIGSDGWHIAAGAGDTVTLQAVLHNLTGNTLRLDLAALNAYSGADGIFYETPDKVNTQAFALADESAGLAQYVTMEDSVLLIAGMSAMLTIRIDLPDTDTGVLLGGIRVSAEGWTIDTAVQIDLPLQAAPTVTAGDITVDGEWISIPVVNASAAIVQSVSAAYEIRDAARSIVAEGTITLPEMAPQTEYRILHPSGSETWESSPYTLNIRLDANGQEEDVIQTFAMGEADRMEVRDRKEITEAPEKPQAGPDAEQSAQQPVSTAAQDEGETVPPAADEPVWHVAELPIGGPGQAAVYGVVLGIPVIFVGVILWVRDKNRRHGKHERPPRLWFGTKQPPSLPQDVV